jgi:sec-independent protein translocase protein TatA
MFGIGMTELLILLVIVLVIFGAGKLPEIGAGMGKAIGNFRKSVREPNEIDITPSQEKEKEKEKEKAEDKEGEEKK